MGLKDGPFRCDKCKAWVFTLPNLHASICYLYQASPEMVASAERYHDIMAATPEVASKPVKKARKRKS
jgi:hypothetical protein